MDGNTTANAGKIALITGANKGIGLETARQLGKLGVTILLGARDLTKGDAAVDMLRGEGIEARPVKLDVNSDADRQAAAKLIEKDYGRLDILVNNAAILLDSRNGNETSVTSSKLLHQTFETNFFSTVALTQALLPLLHKSDAARIVNLSSILASLTLLAKADSPIYNSKTFAYDASKAAVNLFTIHLAHELRSTKIKVNSADPGWVKTEMGGEGATMEISEGAKTSVLLATLPDDGPTGGYFHLGNAQPW